jgi:hypothetical protein
MEGDKLIKSSTSNYNHRLHYTKHTLRREEIAIGARA